jgi:hypothetical protein
MEHVKEMLSLVTLNVYARLIIWDQVVNEVSFKKKLKKDFYYFIIYLFI